MDLYQRTVQEIKYLEEELQRVKHKYGKMIFSFKMKHFISKKMPKSIKYWGKIRIFI